MVQCKIVTTRFPCQIDGNRHYYKSRCSTLEGPYIVTEGISLYKESAREEAITSMREWLCEITERYEETLEIQPFGLSKRTWAT